jgi:hypothetical protein
MIVYEHKKKKKKKKLGCKKLGKLYKRVSNYRVFSIKGIDVAKCSIGCMHLSKPFNVRYSVSLRFKSITEPATRVFHLIF